MFGAVQAGIRSEHVSRAAAAASVDAQPRAAQDTLAASSGDDRHRVSDTGDDRLLHGRQLAAERRYVSPPGAVDTDRVGRDGVRRRGDRGGEG